MDKDFIFQSPFKDSLALFMKQCQSKLAQSSFDDRLRHLLDFDIYLVSCGFKDGDAIDESLITGWISNHKHLAGGTIRLYTIAIREFLRFYSNLTGKRMYEPTLYSVDDSYAPYIFTDGEMEIIYELTDNFQNGRRNSLPYIGIQLPMVIRLLDSNGFRLNELITTKMVDVDLSNGVLKMINTKGTRQRLVPLDAEMTGLLRAYCDAIGLEENSPAFLFPRKSFTEPLQNYDISDRFRYILIKAKIRGKKSSKRFAREACIHCLRHRFTMKAIKQLMDQGIQLEDTVPYLSFYLGHSSVTETELYMKFLSEFFPDELDRFSVFAARILPDETIWNDWL